MELPSKDDKNNAEKQKNTSEKTRSGFWSRLKNYTAEPPKTVVIENGVEKLVLIPPKITITPKTVLPKEETIKGKPAEKPISVSQSAVLEETIKRPASVQQKAVIKEKPVEKPAPVQQKAVVTEKRPKSPPLLHRKQLLRKYPLKNPFRYRRHLS